MFGESAELGLVAGPQTDQGCMAGEECGLALGGAREQPSEPIRVELAAGDEVWGCGH